MKTHILRTLIKHDLDPRKKILSQPEIETWKIIIPSVNDDAQALKPAGKKEFCEFLAAVFTTTKTGKRPLSGNSLYTKFWSPSQASKRTIRNLLNKMIKLIDQEDFYEKA